MKHVLGVLTKKKHIFLVHDHEDREVKKTGIIVMTKKGLLVANMSS